MSQGARQGERRRRAALEARPDAARRARRVVEEVLDGMAPEVLDRAVLLTSELVTNAVVHARGPMGLEVVRDDGGVEICVADGAHDNPVVRHPGLFSDSGRGMAIVASVASAWGVRHTPTGKVVWFVLSTSPSPIGPDLGSPRELPSG